MPMIMTAVQAGEELGFNRKTVGRLCESGQLVGAYRTGVGGHWRIPLSAIDAFRAATRPIRRPPSGHIGQSGQIRQKAC